MENKYEGACQCGEVRYRIYGESINLFVCHCTQCQKQSSSAFGMALWVANYTIESQSGVLKKWTRRTPTGFEMMGEFCGTCGTRVFHHHSANANVISIKLGTLDDAKKLNPVAHIWTSESQPWVIIPENCLTYAENPQGFEEMINAWHELNESYT